ncbi:nucleotidyltransferase family protein [Leptolyngbya sp. PCC 6406]|uniref:nucleotidyltransferase family protein n=1 Tax=Leptolyngbya sp. PCC 6406 TaxID=1173264 RepID=UPI0002AC2EBD|nr:nucleotidyltransferase domain-containing protein [Leptolyngbya sp. PCC 6406]
MPDQKYFDVMLPPVKEDILVQLCDLKSDFADRYAVKQIGIFGSVARNEAHAESDIDIVVHIEPNMFKRFHLKVELETLFGRDVDVIRYWYGMNPYLKARIDCEAIYA